MRSLLFTLCITLLAAVGSLHAAEASTGAIVPLSSGNTYQSLAGQLQTLENRVSVTTVRLQRLTECHRANMFFRPDASGAETCLNIMSHTPVVTCNLPWGGTINAGQCVDAYYQPSVPYGQACQKLNRCCYPDGRLSDAWNYPSCTVQSDPWSACLAGVMPGRGGPIAIPGGVANRYSCPAPIPGVTCIPYPLQTTHPYLCIRQ